MKKFVVISLVGLMVMAFSITAYAQALEFKASGFIDVISEYIKNVPQPGAATSAGGGTSTNNVVFGAPPANYLPATNRAFNEEMAYMENRGRLKFDAIIGKELTGTFFFEIDSTRWGERAPAAGTRNFAGHWGVADRDVVEVKNMFITAALPYFGIPVPMTVQAGIHPMAIRPGFFFLTDGMGVTGSLKLDPVTVKLIWGKAVENLDWAADDSDLYALEANVKVQTITVGGYVLDFNMNTYPVGDHGGSFTTTGLPGFRSNTWWFGAYADGKAGPANFNFDFAYNYGKIEGRNQNSFARDIDIRGWGARARVAFPWEKFEFGALGLYGSGADQRKTSATALPGQTVANTSRGAVTSSKVEAYLVPAGTEGGVGDSLILCGNGINRMNTGFEPAAATQHSRAPIGGLAMLKLFASAKITPSFKTTLETMYVWDTTENGNTIGNARRGGFPRDDNKIGWEIDLLNELQIYKNLVFKFGGGILFAGDAMDYFNTATGRNKEPSNPFVITTNLTYSF